MTNDTPSIAGWQHIENGPVKLNDRYYREGQTFSESEEVWHPANWEPIVDGWTTLVGGHCRHRIYRRIPVAKQGDNDDTGWRAVAEKALKEHASGVRVQPRDDHEMRVEESALPTDAAERKKIPLITGVLFYFPDALCEVAKASLAGQKQHTPGEPLHWDRSKSSDEFDAMGRHLIERGKIDTDGVRHLGKAAWRLLAALQKEIEEAGKESP